MEKNIRIFTRISLLSMIQHSNSVELLWANLVALDKKIQFSTQSISDSYQRNSPFFTSDDEKIIHFSVLKWSNYHRLIHSIAKNEHQSDFHILQPSPYVDHSKQLTKNELIATNRLYNNKKQVIFGYPLLIDTTNRLVKDGLWAYDTTLLYKGINKDIWNDPFHPNPEGGLLVMDKILTVLKENLPQIKRNIVQRKQFLR